MTGPPHPDDIMDFAGLTDLSGIDKVLDQHTVNKCRYQPLLKIDTKRMYHIYDGAKIIKSGRFNSIHEIPIGEQGRAKLEESRLIEFARIK